jgi:hypothetical protein
MSVDDEATKQGNSLLNNGDLDGAIAAYTGRNKGDGNQYGGCRRNQFDGSN